MYADDTVVHFRGNTWDEVFELATEAMKVIKNWYDRNKLSLNVNKTSYITYSLTESRQPGTNYTLKVHNINCVKGIHCNCASITKVDTIKYLGILIDKNINWQHQLKLVNERIRKTIYIFSRLKRILDIPQLKIVYFALVQSILLYGIIAWGGAYASNLRSIKVAQNIILRIILNKGKLDSVKEMYTHLSILPLDKLFKLEILKRVRKNVNLFETFDHGIGTRGFSDQKLKVPQKRTTHAMKHWHYIGPQLYNNLPSELRGAGRNFVKNVKKHILESDT